MKSRKKSENISWKMTMKTTLQNLLDASKAVLRGNSIAAKALHTHTHTHTQNPSNEQPNLPAKKLEKNKTQTQKKEEDKWRRKKLNGNLKIGKKSMKPRSGFLLR